MCNEAARRAALGLIRDDLRQVGIEMTFPEGLPNLAASDSIRIADTSPIIRAAKHDTGGNAVADIVQRRWSWPGSPKNPAAQPNATKPGALGKTVYSYRSEGRELANSANGGRCLIPVDGFYEFTAAEDPKAKRKDKWLFTMPDAAFFCIAGLWRADPSVGEAFTMLTCEPGPDIAPYHARQIVIMPRTRWADWIAGTVPAAALIAPTPAGMLAVARV